MHSKSKKVFEFNQTVVDKFESADAFAAELSLDTTSMLQAAQLLFMPNGQTIRKLVSKKDAKKIDDALKESMGFGLILFDKYYPMYVMTLIQQSDLVQGEMPAFLDQYLHDKAVKAGKKVYGVETIEEQTKALSSLPIKEQTKMLVHAVKNLKADKEKSQKENDKMLELYLKGDTDGLLGLFNKEEQMPAQMKDALLDKRNHVMAERIEPMMQKHSAFIAIGAAHLPGNTGVVQLLRNKGYTVTPIPFQFDGSGFQRITQGDKKLGGATPNNPAEIGADTQGWMQFESPKGNFKAAFPEQPKESTQAADGTTANIVMSIDMTTGKSFLVSFFENNGHTGLNHKEAQDLMNEQIEKSLKQFNGKVIANRTVKIDGGVEGRETVIEVMGVMIVKVRAFMHKNQVYTLTAAGYQGDNFDQEANKFFSSFGFLK